LVDKSTFWQVESLEKPVNMEHLTDRIQHFFETYAFGVCTRIGEILGVATSSIRLFFIYASFITFGSPVIIYLSLAFIMNMRKHLRKRNPVWDY
jgi:phage shock protein PspC (stress-responsive transcriptional regulator)